MVLVPLPYLAFTSVLQNVISKKLWSITQTTEILAKPGEANLCPPSLSF